MLLTMTSKAMTLRNPTYPGTFEMADNNEAQSFTVVILAPCKFEA